MLPFQEPNKFGCSEGNVFDAETQVCKLAEEVRTNLSLKIIKNPQNKHPTNNQINQVPECACWYGCPENSKCGNDCNADCSCGAPAA